MNARRGDVVLGPDFIGGNSKRPFIVINNQKHPFNSEECLVVLVTTTERSEAIPLPDKKFSQGNLPKESYASPWTITTIKTDVIEERIGTLKENTVENIVDQLNAYIK